MHRAVGVESAHRLLFRLDVGRLNDRPPFLELGLVQDGKRLGCLLVRREYLLAETGEARTHGRIGQRFYDRRVELVDHDLRRGFRRPDGFRHRHAGRLL